MHYGRADRHAQHTLGHLSRLGSNACLRLQDTLDLWGLYVCLCVWENTENTDMDEKVQEKKIKYVNHNVI